MPRLNPQRILVRGVNWLGDAVMTTPAMLRLRERFPDACITLLTHAKLRDNFGAIIRRSMGWKLSTRAKAPGASDAEDASAHKFDLGLVLPNSPRSAFELWRAGIPERLGYARPWRNWFLTRAIAPRPGAVAMHKRSEAEIKQLVLQNTGPVPLAAARRASYPPVSTPRGRRSRITPRRWLRN